MSFSVQYAGNGNFSMMVNGQQQTFNLADLNTMLRMEQVSQYDQGIADQLGEIQHTNTKRKALNQLLAKMRSAKSSEGDDNVARDSMLGKDRATIGDKRHQDDYVNFRQDEIRKAHNEIARTEGDSRPLTAAETKTAEAKAMQRADDWTGNLQAMYDDRERKFEDAGAFSLEGYGGPKDVSEWMKEFGITATDVKPGEDKTKRDGQWDANINAVKSEVDNITSDSEMQMLRFRQMVDKRGTALQEAKTTLSNDKRLKDAIIQG